MKNPVFITYPQALTSQQKDYIRKELTKSLEGTNYKAVLRGLK